MSTVENQELQTRKVAIGATSVGAPTSIDLEARTVTVRAEYSRML